VGWIGGMDSPPVRFCGRLQWLVRIIVGFELDAREFCFFVLPWK
jgi:hypothetical protein